MHHFSSSLCNIAPEHCFRLWQFGSSVYGNLPISSAPSGLSSDPILPSSDCRSFLFCFSVFSSIGDALALQPNPGHVSVLNCFYTVYGIFAISSIADSCQFRTSNNSLPCLSAPSLLSLSFFHTADCPQTSIPLPSLRREPSVHPQSFRSPSPLVDCLPLSTYVPTFTYFVNFQFTDLFTETALSPMAPHSLVFRIHVFTGVLRCSLNRSGLRRHLLRMRIPCESERFRSLFSFSFGDCLTKPNFTLLDSTVSGSHRSSNRRTVARPSCLRPFSAHVVRSS